MYITEGEIELLLRHGSWIATLVVCMVLMCFRSFRSSKNPVAWIIWANLACGAVYYGQFPAAVAQNAIFAASDPGYKSTQILEKPRSIYIPDIDSVEKAAYTCHGYESSSSCRFPINEKLKDGTFDFIETGREPVVRYRIHYGSEACFNTSLTPARDPSFLVAGLGVCVLGEIASEPTATHIVEASKRSLPPPSRQEYIHVDLRAIATGQVLAQFDGWKSATPFFLDDPVTEPRRPESVLSDIVRIPYSGTGAYDRDVVERALEIGGFDEKILMLAAASDYQSARVSAIWIGCHESVSSVISERSHDYLRAVSVGLFSDIPDWIYPDSCPTWAK